MHKCCTIISYSYTSTDNTTHT